MYEVAKQISDDRIEVMAGRYLFRFNAQRAADARNAAAGTLGAFHILAHGSGPRWEVWPSKALNSALDTAVKLGTERERERVRSGVVVETVKASSIPLEKRKPGAALVDIPAPVPFPDLPEVEDKTAADGILALPPLGSAKMSLTWLDEDDNTGEGRAIPFSDTTGGWTGTEDDWDAANGGALDIRAVGTGAELDALIGADKAANVRVFLDDSKPVTVVRPRPARRTVAPKGARVPKRTTATNE